MYFLRSSHIYVTNLHFVLLKRNYILWITRQESLKNLQINAGMFCKCVRYSVNKCDSVCVECICESQDHFVWKWRDIYLWILKVTNSITEKQKHLHTHTHTHSITHTHTHTDTHTHTHTVLSPSVRKRTNCIPSAKGLSCSLLES